MGDPQFLLVSEESLELGGVLVSLLCLLLFKLLYPTSSFLQFLTQRLHFLPKLQGHSLYLRLCEVALLGSHPWSLAISSLFAA
jgi:hypothetical protein